MKPAMRCPSELIGKTLDHLRAGGVQGRETVVLWLGRIEDGHAVVHQVYRPEQEADADYFRVPPSSMRALMARLKETRLQVVAQVHSHPQQAFHSKADDVWAIVQHVGAVSIVIPFFARETEPSTFGTHAAAYQLDAEGRWTGLDFVKAVEIG